MLFGTSEASQKLGATKAKLGFFDFEVVRVQILKEGLEATRNHLREKEMRESSAHGQGMIQRARRDSSKYNDIKCEVCAKQTSVAAAGEEERGRRGAPSAAAAAVALTRPPSVFD